jgi:hypothetical protein
MDPTADIAFLVSQQFDMRKTISTPAASNLYSLVNL